MADAQPGAELPAPATPSVAQADRARQVAALYRENAVDLIRLALVMLGDRPSAEDVVQEAFFGLYRRWDGLSDPDKALRYVRSAVSPPAAGSGFACGSSPRHCSTRERCRRGRLTGPDEEL